MLIFVLLSLIRTCISLPTPSPSDSLSPGVPTRTTPGIVWSCLTTIFACTWTAVHPNVPAFDASRSQLFGNRVKILVVALIAPELIVTWAATQFICSKRALKRLRRFSPCSDWTETHGMFLVMGGFMLTDPSGKHLGVLQDEDLEYLLSRKLISFPKISSSEIMDKSKADALAKTLALVQTIWFKPSELELTTIAFAFLNVLTYAFWLKKPQNVRYPILVPLLQDWKTAGLPDDREDTCLGAVVNRSLDIEQQPILARDNASTHPVQDNHDKSTDGLPDDASDTGSGTNESRAIISFIGEIFDAPTGLLDRSQRIEDDGLPEPQFRKNVPAFFGGFHEENNSTMGFLIFFMELLIGALFGSIHCIAWTFLFPTTLERELWRIMSLCMTIAPLTIPLAIFAAAVSLPFSDDTEFFMGIACIPALIYVVARLSMFVLVFVLLRDLPTGVLEDVQWSKYIPHV
ncbi:hypothetical protein BT96DRAFT_1016287 [Gymnopus androsaceus JB14]|uniref:Uncharacterized protein n=1 Tax=Gymnopus androsaceus JB14 TaxID=1447944 RepID=A0A6A4I5T9_9AGAR|nr:hypothetical protein BT96DRAFT_1016287 [Gymnopus androsaceus JB14]